MKVKASGQSLFPHTEAFLEFTDVDDTAAMGSFPNPALVVPGFDPEEDALLASMAVTSAIARTLRPMAVAARWRTLISMPTLTNPAGNADAIADPAAISMCSIIIGVA